MKPNLRLAPPRRNPIDWRNVFIWAGAVLLSAALWFFLIVYVVPRLVWR